MAVPSPVCDSSEVKPAIQGQPIKGDTVQLVGFGSSSAGVRVGRNSATGAEIQIAAANTVKFTAAKGFKDAVSGA